MVLNLLAECGIPYLPVGQRSPRDWGAPSCMPAAFGANGPGRVIHRNSLRGGCCEGRGRNQAGRRYRMAMSDMMPSAPRTDAEALARLSALNYAVQDGGDFSYGFCRLADSLFFTNCFRCSSNNRYSSRIGRTFEPIKAPKYAGSMIPIRSSISDSAICSMC